MQARDDLAAYSPRSRCYPSDLSRQNKGQGMGFRFYRRIRVIPGIALNLGKRCICASDGALGTHVTFCHDGRLETAELAGKALSRRTDVSNENEPLRKLSKFRAATV